MYNKEDSHSEDEDQDKLLSQQLLADMHLCTQDDLGINISMAIPTEQEFM